MVRISVRVANCASGIQILLASHLSFVAQPTQPPPQEGCVTHSKHLQKVAQLFYSVVDRLRRIAEARIVASIACGKVESQFRVVQIQNVSTLDLRGSALFHVEALAELRP